ncbi:protein Wnt-5-like isoform X1 [Drosophila miranda]|uniref:protein Wnt-5-like isoform X1 n=1 Tax=Drosophila miranda TaxID=7229 RepID=UPI00143FB55D|nr:protein Wnt-5-like isoform X1 [Drosophila miranda]XP_033248410.1 protein Wnt-5-like isoform X1 [Drosophila miranda]XP_033248411.1 protein Wnt-5-like isoform X1 [Drosophila miranda]
MNVFKRKHCPLWIVYLICVFLMASRTNAAAGSQGVPTWMCLGLRSPFIEFGSQEEQLANTSIPLNITKDEQAYMHQEGLRKLGTFIKPVDLRDSQTGFVKADLTKRLTNDPPRSRRIHPIQEEMDQKQIVLLDDDTDENGLPASLTDEDRKFIVPMALKNASPDPGWLDSASSHPPVVKSTFVAASNTQRRATQIAHSSTSTKLEVDPTSNIDDLKKHILFLHNMTKTNTNFESKFVKFPSLQKDKAKQSAGSPTNVKRPPRPVFQYAAPIAPPTRKVPHGAHTPGQQPFGGYYHNDEDINTLSSFLKPVADTNDSAQSDGNRKLDNIPIVPQVHLLNEDESTTRSTTEETVPTIVSPGNLEPARTTKRPACLRNPESPKCIRQRRREEQQRQRERDEWFRGQSEYIQPRFQPIIQTINNTRRFAVSIEIPDSFKAHSALTSPSDEAEDERLNRMKRSQPSGQKAMKEITEGSAEKKFDKLARETDYFDRDIVMTSADVASGSDFLIAKMTQNGLVSPKEQYNDTTSRLNAYSEKIDLNPNSCYKINGLSYGQKKQCVKHTSVMPAISRGARAAIQECQFQFKSRRWNCSTTNDETVFGPMTSLAAPEMAFIHALAAATVTSFIARACRDGQLASCGCSRGNRPKQLHDDWTWGGCGDNLEYAYKFATDFIDVREKEAHRETRGVRKRTREITLKTLMLADDIKTFGTSELETTNATFLINAKNDTIDNSSKELSKKSSANNNYLRKDLVVTATPLKLQRKENSGPGLPDDLFELQQRITKEILNSKLEGREMLVLQEKINREILNSKIFQADGKSKRRKRKRKNQRAVVEDAPIASNNDRVNYVDGVDTSTTTTTKARSLMNLHNNEAGRRAVIKKTRITCKCHGVSGSCSLITCWQQLSSIREIGDYLREKYEEATKVKINKRGRLQVKDSQFKVPTAHDLIYIDESPDWCRSNYVLHWPGTHGRVCHKSSSGLDSCAILCCGRGYNTKNIVVHERCNCKFHWCCQVKCEVCTKVLEEHTCK